MATFDRFGVGTLGLLAAALLATAPAARAGDPAGTPTRLLLGPGSVVPGSPVGNVAFSPQRVAYGDAGWVMNVTMDGHVEMIVTEHGIGLYEGQPLAGGNVVHEIFNSVDSDASGRLATVFFPSDGTLGVAIDETIALITGSPVSAAGLPAGSTWAALLGVDFDTTGHLVVLGTVAEPSAPGAIDALVRYDIGAGGALGNPLVLLSEHSLVEGRAIQGIGSYSDLSFARNDTGHLLCTVEFVDGDGQGPGPAAIVLDGVVLAEHGTPSIIDGRDWSVSLSDPVALNARGDYAFRTRIQAGLTNGFDLLVHNGAVAALETTPVPGLPGTKITRLHAPRLGNDGTLLYLVEWDESPFVPRQGFIVDDQLAVATLATQIEGETLAGLHNDAMEYDLSPDGRRFAFVGYTAFGGWGAYEAPTGPWQDLLGSLAGTGGAAPTLFGLGSLKPSSLLSLDLAGAVPGSVTNLVLGLSHLGLPFHGGVLVPSPDAVLYGLPVNAAGKLKLSGTLPGGLPSALPLHFQFWSVGAGAPTGYSATNGLVALTP